MPYASLRDFIVRREADARRKLVSAFLQSTEGRWRRA